MVVSFYIVFFVFPDIIKGDIYSGTVQPGAASGGGRVWGGTGSCEYLLLPPYLSSSY